METVIETVQFRLIDGVTEQDFLSAAKLSQTFVKQLPGFLYRSLSHEAKKAMRGQTSSIGVHWKTQIMPVSNSPKAKTATLS
ncbi:MULTISPECIES: hypothetical protein [Vibrio]|uniref:hypothetical protein n=1 Tax=Vibrio TaxID=662 RepID=UPI000422AD4D|nr:MULTISPECIES: hypothetical protein [Vibrio]